MAAFVIVVVVSIIVGLFVAFVVQVCPAPTSHHIPLYRVADAVCVRGRLYSVCRLARE